MKNVNFAEQKVLYQSNFGLTNIHPSRYTIVQPDPDSEEVIGFLEEPGSMVSGHYKSLSAALAYLGELIYFGHHAGHKGSSFEPLPTGPDGTHK